MKYFRIQFALILLLISQLVTAAAKPSALMGQGNDLYKNGKYEDAVTSYQLLVKEGYLSSELYFNLGNAYFKMKNYPMAVLYFEKASLLDPSDDEISYNLGYTRLLTGDKLEGV